MSTRPFLTAEWRDLIMLNYAVSDALLLPLVPAGTELDHFKGQTFISIVGFRFLQTRLLGLPVPFHRNFEEINLRFYVRRKVDGEWRKGVVFIREIVPRAAIAFVARAVYGEPYIALPTAHESSVSGAEFQLTYRWKHAGRWNFLQAVAHGGLHAIQTGSSEEFLTENYWGYTARKNSTVEYHVAHPGWRIWTTAAAKLDCDAAQLYGERFSDVLSSAPTTSFIAEGSPVTVFPGTKL